VFLSGDGLYYRPVRPEPAPEESDAAAEAVLLYR
jgi:hypothetical protein